jgi:hypothetical protein
MPFSLESFRRVARFRPLVLCALMFTVAACGDSVTPTSPDAVADGITIDPTSDQPLASAFAGGIPFGNFAQPISQLGSIYNGAHENSTPTGLLKELQASKARGGKVILALSGAPRYYVDGAGNFSLTKWKERVNRFRNVNFRSYIEDGTIVGHYLIDEPNDAANWNGREVSAGTVEEMARYSKSLWPTMVTIVRAEPKHMGTNHRYLDAAWAQYLYRRGNVNEYIKDVVGDAQRRGLALVVGMNVLKGGSPHGTRMTASEVESWGSALLSSSYPCAFINWEYNSDYHNSSSIRSAMSSLRRKAENRSTKSCRA